MIRVEKTTEIIVDDFNLDEDIDGKSTKLSGVLKFTFDNDTQENMIAVMIGTRQLGFISRAGLIECAETILKEWKTVGE